VARQSLSPSSRLPGENDAASARRRRGGPRRITMRRCGATREERRDCRRAGAGAAAAGHRARAPLDKMVLRAAADGVVTVIAARWARMFRGPTDPDGRGGGKAMALVQCGEDIISPSSMEKRRA